MLFAVAVVVNLAFGVIVQFKSSPTLLDMDEQEYWDLASQILNGSFQISARRTIVFPMLLAGLRTILPSFLALQAVIALFYAFSPPLLFLLVRKLTDSSAAALAAAVMLLCWPPAIFYGVSLYSESIAMPVFLCSLLILPLGDRLGLQRLRPGLSRTLLAGLVLGLAAHIRPMYLLFTPFLAIIICFEEVKLATALKRIMVAALGFILIVGPWAAFQTARFGHPILLTANGGETLAGGLNPNVLKLADVVDPTPGGRRFWTGPGKWVAIADTGYLTPQELALPYDQQDELLRRRAMDWVRANPGDAIFLELRKLTYMWGIWPIMPNGPKQIVFGNIPTILLLLLSMSLARRNGRANCRLVRFAILPAFVSVVALISWGSWRFRQPGDVGLIAFCAVSIYWKLQARVNEVRTFAAT